jgi:hypothetical protein
MNRFAVQKRANLQVSTVFAAAEGSFNTFGINNLPDCAGLYEPQALKVLVVKRGASN